MISGAHRMETDITPGSVSFWSADAENLQEWGVRDTLYDCGTIALCGAGRVTLQVVVTPVAAVAVGLTVMAVIPLAAGGVQLSGIVANLKEGEFGQALACLLMTPVATAFASLSPAMLLGAGVGVRMGAYAGDALANNVWRCADESRARLSGGEFPVREPLRLRQGTGGGSVAREVLLKMASFEE